MYALKDNKDMMKHVGHQEIRIFTASSDKQDLRNWKKYSIYFVKKAKEYLCSVMKLHWNAVIQLFVMWGSRKLWIVITCMFLNTPHYFIVII